MKNEDTWNPFCSFWTSALAKRGFSEPPHAGRSPPVLHVIPLARAWLQAGRSAGVSGRHDSDSVRSHSTGQDGATWDMEHVHEERAEVGARGTGMYSTAPTSQRQGLPWPSWAPTPVHPMCSEGHRRDNVEALETL